MEFDDERVVAPDILFNIGVEDILRGGGKMAQYLR